jgi:hypothetical protein
MNEELRKVKIVETSDSYFIVDYETGEALYDDKIGYSDYDAAERVAIGLGLNVVCD